MNQEKLIICKHEIDKLMREYAATSGVSRPLSVAVSQNYRAIYLLAEIVQALLKDKE